MWFPSCYLVLASACKIRSHSCHCVQHSAAPQMQQVLSCPWLIMISVLLWHPVTVLCYAVPHL